MPESLRRVAAGQFSLGTAEEVRACLEVEDGRPYIALEVCRRTAEGEVAPSGRGLRFPATLLPELKRLVQHVEECLIREGFSDDFQDLAQLRAEREVAFAHPSEREFARLLDFYRIPWEYEPRTFPIQWDAQGNVVESFTPDFYLPEQDLYIELTTRKQSLVTKKNRKLRLFRQHYPEVKLKVFYGKDYRRLLQKYGVQVDTK
ncbi:MAG: hypothetical protein KatS3mg131_3693 [Candidatus Tectimicrobiota bacterium]|nr:MAG: hypothetical protein KatS3mg131_3693 [Candidatus Tectomicrobia bacterium]